MIRPCLSSFAFLFLLSCHISDDNRLPMSTGNAGEIIVVAENTAWNAQPGEAIRKVLAMPLYGLPQPEPKFDLISIPHSAFTKIFRFHKNLLIVDISGKQAKSTVVFKKDSWSAGQIIVHISAKSSNDFISLFNKNAARIEQVFTNMETNRIVEANKYSANSTLSDSISKTHNIRLVLPENTQLAAHNNTFFWIRKDRMIPLGGISHQVSQGVFYYKFPYRDTSDFALPELMHKRDSVTAKYIFGPGSNTFMEISHRNIEPSLKKVYFKKRFAVEIRGLWRMKRGFLGGPFYELCILEKDTIHVIDGYVFAPQFKKREYLRNVEAVAKSLSFIDE